jgi:hypothetical protein
MNKERISRYISLLSYISQDTVDFKEWIPNCITCLQFALDNEELLREKQELYYDTAHTLNLLHFWIVDNKEWAYVELRQKFRNVYTAKEVGDALKKILARVDKEDVCPSSPLVNCKNINGELKSLAQILTELGDQFSKL